MSAGRGHHHRMLGQLDPHRGTGTKTRGHAGSARSALIPTPPCNSTYSLVSSARGGHGHDPGRAVGVRAHPHVLRSDQHVHRGVRGQLAEHRSCCRATHPARTGQSARDAVHRADELGHERGRRVLVQLDGCRAYRPSRPSRSTATRSAMDSASSWSCVTKIVAMPQVLRFRDRAPAAPADRSRRQGSWSLLPVEEGRGRLRAAARRQSALSQARAPIRRRSNRICAKHVAIGTTG